MALLAPRTTGRTRLPALPDGVARAVLPVIGAAVFLAAWEVTGRRGTFGTAWIPLTEIWDELTAPSRRALFERAVTATFSRAATGLVTGVGLAVAMATVAAVFPRLRAATGRLAVSLNSIPWIALGPLLMVTVSRDTAPAVIAGLAVFFQMFVAATAGYAAVAREQRDLLAALGTNRIRAFLLVVLPTAVPSLFLGLKLAAPAALIGAIFGEWFGAERGIGLLLLTSMQSFNMPLLWSVALMAAGTSMAAYTLFGLAERAAARRFSPTATTPTPTMVRTATSGLRSLLATVVVLVTVVVAWHVYVERTDISAILVPAPSAVGRALLDDWSAYLDAVWVTVQTASWGISIGTVVGVTFAVTTWWSATLRGLLTPLVLVARSVPTLALMPVVAGVLGYNTRALIALAVLMSFFPTFVFTTAGLRSLPAGSADLMAALGVPRRRMFRLVALPAATRQIVIAVRLSAGLCVIAAVVAEFMIGREGLGRLFSSTYGRQDMAAAWGAALLIVALAMAAFALASKAEHRVSDRMT
jgi:sulfonate transport system permease protein